MIDTLYLTYVDQLGFHLTNAMDTLHDFQVAVLLTLHNFLSCNRDILQNLSHGGIPNDWSPNYVLSRKHMQEAKYKVINFGQ